MEHLHLFSKADLKKILKKRRGETKFGQDIEFISIKTTLENALQKSKAKYIIFGIAEDIGVFANYGKQGCSKTWQTVLETLVNIQSNTHTKATKVAILGHLDFTKELEHVTTLNQDKKGDIKTARTLVESVDKVVSHLIYTIVNAGKIPIIIGGGHNNAYGNIKGTALALKQPINVINFDAHTDFRTEEGRHSGNGFAYAFSEGFLNTYFIFGLHESYTSKAIFKLLNRHKNRIQYNTFESLKVRKELKFKTELKRALQHVSKSAFGVEIDCDAIENISSSAETPSGFSVEKARHFVHTFGLQNNAKYLHICEAIPKKKTSKLITYLITDFIRANAKKTS